jgi:predicted tellurium resistance membrane protein TerC
MTGEAGRLRRAAIASIAWLGVAALVGVALWLAGGPADAGSYASAYLIERALSLDNVVVFLMLFAAFGIAGAERRRLLWWGIAGAIVLRALAILGGVALVDRFEPVLYVLGVLLLYLAWRMLKGGTHQGDPERLPAVRAARRVLPGASPFLVCLVAVVLADLAFALDSVPAAMAITRDPLLIWLANAMALLGLGALFVLADGLLGRLRYLQQTLAALLGLVALKLLTEDLVHIGPAVSVAAVVLVLLVGTAASLAAGRRPLAPRVRAFVDELGERREHHRSRSLPLRLGFGALALGVTSAGLAMLVLPGPGLLFVAIGVAMLALEFAWAEQLVRRVMTQAERAGGRRGRGVVLAGAAVAAGGAAIVATAGVL